MQRADHLLRVVYIRYTSWYTSFLKYFGRVKLSGKTRKMSVRHDVAEPARPGLNTSNLTDVGARHHAGPVKVAIHQSQTGVQPSSSETCGESLEVETVKSSCLGDDLEFSALGLFGFFKHREPFSKNVEILKNCTEIHFH